MRRRRIIFRADAGPNIGYGHFIRTLALADMLKCDFECMFYTQRPTDYQIREITNICEYVPLPTNGSKFPLFIEALTGDEIVVLDNYFYTTYYQTLIKKKGCRLVCIDDMHDKHYVSDVVINFGSNNPLLFDIEPYTQLCLGLEWALLRRPFLQAIPFKNRIKGNIAISFGGVDSSNLTEMHVKRLSISDSIDKITAIVGDGFRFSEDLKLIEKVNVEKNISASRIADLFCKVEFAILSASSICIEAIACGCPVYIGWYTENQREMYNFLIKNKYAKKTDEIPLFAGGYHDRSLNTSIFSEIEGRYNSLFHVIAEL